jgi:hypothetical protein
MDELTAKQDLEEYLSDKNLSTPTKRVKAIKAYLEDHQYHPITERLGLHALRHAETEVSRARFSKFLSANALLLRKKEADLTSEEYSKIKEDFKVSQTRKRSKNG